jgi:hypothetical protein
MQTHGRGERALEPNKAALPAKMRAPAPIEPDAALLDERRLLALQRLAGNAAVAARVVAQRAKTKKAKKVKKAGGVKKSKFDDLTTRPSEIYALCKIKKGKKYVYYVGQTVQGAAKRHKQHAAKNTKRANMVTVVLKRGNWTPLETATWEQRYINEYASGGATLDNHIYAITPAKYKMFRALGRKDMCPQLKTYSQWPAHVG